MALMWTRLKLWPCTQQMTPTTGTLLRWADEPKYQEIVEFHEGWRKKHGPQDVSSHANEHVNFAGTNVCPKGSRQRCPGGIPSASLRYGWHQSWLGILIPGQLLCSIIRDLVWCVFVCLGSWESLSLHFMFQVALQSSPGNLSLIRNYGQLLLKDGTREATAWPHMSSHIYLVFF